MNEDDTSRNHDKTEDTTDKTWKEISEYIRGGSLLEIYMNASSVVTDNEILNFKIRQICVKTGMNLLPIYNTEIPDDERKEMKSFYQKIRDNIKSFFPKARRAQFSFRNLGEKNAEVYKITSDEDFIHDYDSRPEDVHDLLIDYRRNQFELYSMKLDEYDNMIREYLTRYDIIPRSNPDIEIDKSISNMLQDLFKKQVQNLIKEQKNNAK